MREGRTTEERDLQTRGQGRDLIGSTPVSLQSRRGSGHSIQCDSHILVMGEKTQWKEVSPRQFPNKQD